MKFIIINIIISFAIAIICSIKSNYQEGLFNLAMALFLPIGGGIIILIMTITKNMKSREIEDEEDVNILLFTERVRKEEYVEAVPLEETLILNSNEIKRKKIMEALKGDVNEYMDVFNMALRDDDVETAHYASTFMMEVKKTLELKLQKLQVEYENDDSSIDVLIAYKDTLKEYINTKIIDNFSLHKYKIIYEDILKKLIKLYPEKEYYVDLIESMLKNKDIGNAFLYCKEFLNEYICEEAYMVNLKCLYMMGDEKNFEITFEELKASSIVLSPKGLEMVRFWTEDRADEG